MADSDRRELTDDFGVALRANNDALQSTIWTALPGFVVKFDPVLQTCQVQPTIQAQVLNAAGVKKNVTLPLLVDCPVVFPHGGGFALTFPINVGDECLVIFSSRCIDSWWHSSGVQVQAELRMHDLSDGFVIPGPRSQPNVIKNFQPDRVELRNDSRDTLVSIDAAGAVVVKAAAKITLNAPEVDITATNVKILGNVAVTGNMAVSGALGTTAVPNYALHTHTGVRGGPDISGPPVPGT